MNSGPARPALKRPQLTLDELHQLKWLLGGVVTLLAVGTVFYMDIGAWVLMALVGATSLVTLRWPSLPSRLPGMAHTLAFPIIVAFFVGDLWLGKEVLPAMVRLDMMLLLYRSLSYRQRRDDLQVIVLGLFLIVVAGVLTVSLLFAVHLMLYTACALAFLLSITLTDAANAGQRQPPGARNETPAWVAHTDWRGLFRRMREVTDWRVLGLGALLFACVVAVSALLFLAIPRFQIENGMFIDRFISKKAKSGFSDTIRFGDVTEIEADTSVALSVDVSDQSEVPAAPYWRMFVLDDYRDGTFRQSASLRSTAFSPERTSAQVLGDARPRRGPAVYWTFYLESGVSRFLPLLGEFHTLQFRDPQNYRRATELNVIALRDEPLTMTAYKVEGFVVGASLPDPQFARRWRDRVAETSARNLYQVRTLNDTGDRAVLTRIDRQIGVLGDAGAKVTATEFCTRANTWLQANHSYSRTPRIPSGPGDPLVRWLASREDGHCELFAGSFVVLARAAGFPARVVTGFKGGTWNDYSKNFTVRNSDAHAWAEIFDAPSGSWLRSDPLAVVGPAQAEETKGAAALATRTDRSWGARFDSLRVFWYRRIVSFDQQSQVETVKALKEATQNAGRRVREAVAAVTESVRQWLRGPWDYVRFGKLIGWIAAALLPWWAWRQLGRGWWRRWAGKAGGRREDPVRREAGRWLRRVVVMEIRIPEAALVVAELQRVRFGARASWPDPERVFRRAKAVLRRKPG